MTTAAPIEASPAAEAEDWLTPGRFALVLALLIFAMFPGVLLGGSTFVMRDFGLFGYPLAYFHRESFWRGELPLWNPLSSGGVPFLAQWNTLTLYPLSLIYLLLPLSWSVSFFCLAHMFWGGLGMYCLAYGWTNHRLGAALAGVIFSFNGLALNFLLWPNMIAAFAWLPWVVWLGRRAWAEGERTLAWATLAGVMQMLSGGPETILFTWLILFLLACGDWLHGEAPRSRIFLRFLGMAFLVALASAAQLLPFLALLYHCQRDSGFGAADWAMPIWGWANLLVPLFRCASTAQGAFQQIGQYWTASYYPGIATLLLAVIAVARDREWRARWLAGLMMLALVLALGDRGLLYHALYVCLPGFGLLRYPVKCVILVLALAPLLAAFGLKALDRSAGSSQAAAGFGSSGNAKAALLGRFALTCVLMILLLIGIILWLAWKFPLPGQVWSATWQSGLFRAGFLVLMVFVSAVLLNSRGRRRALCACLLLVLFWLDFATHAPGLNPTVRPWVYAPGWASAHVKWQGVQPKAGEARLMLAPIAHEGLRNLVLPEPEENYLMNRLAFFADCNLLENVPQVFGFFSLTPREAYRATMLPYVHLDREFPMLLDFLAVAQMTAPGKTTEWAPRPTAMPFVTAGQQPVFADDTAAYDAFYQTNLDLRKIVVLPPEARAEISASHQPEARAGVTAFANQRISIRTECPATSLVVLSQTYYPAWRAYVEGKAAKMWRANYAFQALQVPAGRHEVELRYEDRPLHAGLILSGLGLLAWLSLWVKRR